MPRDRLSANEKNIDVSSGTYQIARSRFLVTIPWFDYHLRAMGQFFPASSCGVRDGVLDTFCCNNRIVSCYMAN